MRCRKVQKLLADLELGILSPSRISALEVHVSKCPVCRLAGEKLKTAAKALTKDFGFKPPRHLAAQVMHRASQKAGAQNLRRPWIPALATATAILLVAGFSFLFLSRSYMTNQEVFQGYAEDLSSLDFLEKDQDSEYEIFNYEEFGIPADIAKLMI